LFPATKAASSAGGSKLPACLAAGDA
jgi:hypothetical protein